MKNSISRQAVVVAATAVTCFAAVPFDLSWYSIDGGGAMRSTSTDGVFELSGTIGQFDAGVMTGGDFKLTGGFWFEIPPGDCNADGIVGLSDHPRFLDCLTGPAGGIELGCECFDVNHNGTIDLADFSENQIGFLGG